MEPNDLPSAEETRRAKNNERARRYRNKHKDDPAYIARMQAQYQQRKEYHQEYGAKYRETRKDALSWKHRQREYNQKYKDNRTTRLDKSHLNRQYGMSIEQYNVLLIQQGGLCRLCDKGETATRAGQVKNLSVDHCHSTGKVRGLLCGKCNAAIGFAEDDPERIRRAISYLEESVTKS